VVARQQLLCKQEAVQNGSGGKNRGNIQLEVRLHEWWHGSNCHVMTRQCKVEVVAKKKKVTINQRCGSMSGSKTATDVQQGRQGAVAKKGGNNQLEVWLHEWWHSCCAMSLRQAVGSTKWKWQQKEEKGKNQPEVWQHEWW